MSFFSKISSSIKKVTDRVTGGYGKVEMHVGQRHAGILPVRVTLAATGELKADNIMLELHQSERFRYDEDRTVHDRHHVTWQEQSELSQSNHKVLHKVELSGELTMAEGETREFTAEIPVPDNLPGTAKGRHFELAHRLDLRVDIPWGVDLRENQEVQLGTPPALPEPVVVRESFGAATCELSYAPEGVSGSTLPVKLRFDGEMPSLRVSEVRLRSIESVIVEVTWRRHLGEHEREEAHHHHDRPVEIELTGIEWSSDDGFGLMLEAEGDRHHHRHGPRRRIDGEYEVLDFGKRTRDDIQVLEFPISFQGSEANLQLPLEGVPPTLLSDYVRHRVYLEVSLQSNQREFVFEREIIIH
ncbi:MAG: sporulation protein [Candidatus Eremiobacteraeota bacterium]|nr:sporulation protein [Candidatus Eremiobacteraeota bacterium]